MGALAFLIIMGFAVLLGLGVGIFGLIGTILSAKRKRKVLLGVSIAALVSGLLIMAFPVAFVGSIFLDNARVPDDFVETGIVMEQVEERDYQVFSFTADGVRYAALEVEPDFVTCSRHSEAVFEYRPEGLLSRNQWTNYYRLDNAGGFDLIWDGWGSMFCPENQTLAVYSYLRSEMKWVFGGDDGERIPLSAEACDVLDQYPPIENYPVETTTVPKGQMIEYVLMNVSGNGLVVFEHREIGIMNGNVCMLIAYQYDENGNVTYTYIPYPQALAEPILAAIRSAEE